MDQLTLEIISGALQSVAAEACGVLSRTAMSPNIRYCRDCSVALYTPEGKLATIGGPPVNPGILPAAVNEVLKVFPAQSLSPGDCIITNDPYITGSPLPQVCAVSPAFYGGRPLALVASIARYGDLGGSVPGSLSTASDEIFQEGIRIPPVRIMKKGEFNNHLVSLLTANIRTGNEFMANLRAQSYASKSAEKRLAEICGRYGLEKLKRFITEMINHSETRMRSALNEIPPGESNWEDFPELDDQKSDGVEIRVSVKCEVDSLTVDFTGTQQQVNGPFNLTRGFTMACVYSASVSAIDPGIPINDGTLRPFTVITPEGSLVNAIYPAAVAYGHTVARRVIASVSGCLAQLTQGIAPAAGSGGMISIAIGNTESEGGSNHSLFEACGGGFGAKPTGDGPDGVHMNMTPKEEVCPLSLFTPVEVIEQSYPLMVNSFRLIEGSGGPGKFRGGLGLKRSITLLGNKPVISICADDVKTDPPGLSGGLPGSKASVTISRPKGHEESSINILSGKYTGTVEKGSVITLKTAGGGGFGAPLDRNPELVRKDVLEGFITIDQARHLYGVILSGHDMQIDEAATSASRKLLKQQSS